jgi:hypothetical protein
MLQIDFGVYNIPIHLWFSSLDEISQSKIFKPVQLIYLISSEWSINTF